MVGTDKFGNKYYQNDDELPREAAIPTYLSTLAY